MKTDPTLHGAALPAPTKKPNIAWRLPYMRIQQKPFQCNPTALCNVIQCHPRGRQMSQGVAEQIYDKVKRPDKATVMLDVLEYAKNKGLIEDFEHTDEPGLSLLKQWMKEGPVLIGTSFRPCMYDNTGPGNVIQMDWSQDIETGHTWCGFGMNREKKIFGTLSSWQKDEPYKFTFADMDRLLREDDRPEIARIAP